MAFFNGQFFQRHIVPAAVYLPAEHQRIPGQDRGVPLRDQSNSVPPDENDQGIGHEVQFPDRLARPRMILWNPGLYQTHFGFILIIVEGFEHLIAVGLHHMQTTGEKGKKGALKGDRQQADTKHDMEHIVFQRGIADRCENGKHNGRGSPEPCPGNEQLLPQRRARRRKERKHHNRAGNKGEEKGNGDRRQQNRGHLRRKRQQAEQKEDHDLRQAGDPIEEMHQRAFVRNAAVAEEDPRQIGGEIAVSADHRSESVGQHRRRDDE